MRKEEVTHYALRITHYALRITHYALRITHYALRITHYALRITHYALRITHYALRLAETRMQETQAYLNAVSQLVAGLSAEQLSGIVDRLVEAYRSDRRLL